MRKARTLVLLGALAVAATTTTLSSPAYAQNDAALNEAKQRFEEGLKFADEGNHEQARLKFSQAWAVFKSASVLYNLARSEQLTGHDLEAFEHFRQFLKMGADPKISDQQRAKAEENLRELSKKVAQLDLAIPAGAQVKVDGKPLAGVPHEALAVPPGRHVVEATYKEKFRSVAVDCVAGDKKKAALDFDDVNAPPREEEKTFWSTGRVVGAAVAGAGVASLGVGVGFWFIASTTDSDAKNTRATLPDRRTGCFGDTAASNKTCENLRSLEDDYKTQSMLRTTFIGVGAALVVGGAALFIASGPGRKEQAKGPRVVPIASAREAGVVLVGEF